MVVGLEELLPDELLDLLVLGEGALGVLVDGLLLLVLAQTVAAVEEEEPDDFGERLAGLGLELLDGVVEGGVAGVGDLPVGVRAQLEQQLDQFDLGLADGGDEQRLVAGFPIDLLEGGSTRAGSFSSSCRRMASPSSRLLLSTA